ncbi:MAG: 1-acyl-sn-glycerol-3-phosphate acyltransferase [Bacteroidales bacterium]|nr:1-acyl-sn-glycerol-3-phosphate acyltransferase [Bacteroidales bacterium]
MQKTATFILKIIGWKISGEIPADIKKAVLIQAPHTSLWDFVIGRIVFWHYAYPIKLLIKKEAFKWPFGGLMRALGGIPVNRKKNEKMVDAVARMVNEHERIVLVITPEATRKRVENWKRGFYYIALKAEVPIALGWIDYPDKRGGIGPLFYPTGNFEKDFNEIQDFYRGFRGKHPERFNL